MQSAWLRWAKEHHTFSNVKFSAEQASRFSATVREFMDNEGDHFVLMSLKYSFPAKPKANEKPRPLSSDQVLQNDVFTRECKKIWKRARDIVEGTSASKHAVPDDDNVQSHKDEKGSKSTVARPVSSSATSIFSFGLPLLRQWLEEDEDAAQEKAKEIASEKAMEKKVAYEGFVKNKDR
jgi:hypothetical protein